MKKTSNISLGGYAFVIEDDALEALKRYIDKVRTSSSEDVREELVADIEERLAELFIEKSGKGVVIDIKTVDSAAARIGIPEDGPAEDHGTVNDGRSSGNQGTDFLKKKLFRDVDDRIIGGVMAGISKWSGVDLIVLRLVTAIIFASTFFGHNQHTHRFGLGMLFLYILLWVIVPAPKTVEDKCRAQGKPINYDDFKLRAENFKDSVVETAKEARTAPFFNALGRAVAAIVGVIFIIVGMAVSISALVAAISVPSGFADIHWIIRDPHVYDILTACTASPVIIWTAIGAVAVLGISFLYSGVMTAFALKEPKWHPGLLIFLLWIGLVITCVVFAAKEFAFSVPWVFAMCMPSRMS
ncbi:MAG: PspC domain-containing protein [Bacteroidales bacterium]|nr:PspC domain-containing protein [Bacteroidales bacterium]